MSSIQGSPKVSHRQRWSDNPFQVCCEWNFVMWRPTKAYCPLRCSLRTKLEKTTRILKVEILLCVCILCYEIDSWQRTFFFNKHFIKMSCVCIFLHHEFYSFKNFNEAELKNSLINKWIIQKLCNYSWRRRASRMSFELIEKVIFHYLFS